MASIVYLSLVLLFSSIGVFVNSIQVPARRVRVNRNNETYVLFAGEGVKFEESTDICHNQFGGSVVIRDRNDQEFLKTWFKDISMQTDDSSPSSSTAAAATTTGDSEQSFKTWLGARYFRENSGRLVWQTLQQKSRQAFAFWAPKEPKCYSSCCGVAIDTNGAWYTLPCDWKAQVLCKMSKSDSERYLQSLRDEEQSTTEATLDGTGVEVSDSRPVIEVADSESEVAASDESELPNPRLDNKRRTKPSISVSKEQVQSKEGTDAITVSQMKVQLVHLEDQLSMLWQNVTRLTSLLEEEREARRSEMKATMGRLRADFESSLKSLEKMIRTRLPHTA